MLQNLPPTESLLLFCVGSQSKRLREKMILSLIEEKINWEKFFSRAKTLGIAPHCYLFFQNTDTQIPSEMKKKLAEYFTLNSIRNVKLWAILIKILRVFNEANIDAIPLKGPHLSDILYGDIGVRTSSDLDILIQKKDYARARQAMIKVGYFPLKTHYSEGFIMNFLRHRMFITQNINSLINPSVEIHWNFYPQRPQEFNMTPVWKTAVLRKEENTHFLSLSPSFILLHLAIGLRIHGYSNFRNLCDLDSLLTNFKDEIEWDYIVKQAVINKQRIALFFALCFTRELFDTEIPLNIFKRIKPGSLQKKLVYFFMNPRKILFKKQEEDSMFYSDFINLLTIDSFIDALKILKRTIFSHAEDMTERYKKGLFVEKFNRTPLLRPFYLVWSIIRSIIHYVIKLSASSL